MRVLLSYNQQVCLGQQGKAPPVNKSLPESESQLTPTHSATSLRDKQPRPEVYRPRSSPAPLVVGPLAPAQHNPGHKCAQACHLQHMRAGMPAQKARAGVPPQHALEPCTPHSCAQACHPLVLHRLQACALQVWGSDVGTCMCHVSGLPRTRDAHGACHRCGPRLSRRLAPPDAQRALRRPPHLCHCASCACSAHRPAPPASAASACVCAHCSGLAFLHSSCGPHAARRICGAQQVQIRTSPSMCVCARAHL